MTFLFDIPLVVSRFIMSSNLGDVLMLNKRNKWTSLVDHITIKRIKGGDFSKRKRTVYLK